MNEEEIEVFCCSYCDKEFDTLKGVTYYENLYCKYKNNKSTKSNKNITSKKMLINTSISISIYLGQNLYIYF
jgi:hypothetical protein